MEASMKVLIADDHKMFRQGLRMLFEMEPDIKIVGEARDGLDVRELEAEPLAHASDPHGPQLVVEDAERIGPQLLDRLLEPRPTLLGGGGRGGRCSSGQNPRCRCSCQRSRSPKRCSGKGSSF